MSTPIDWSKWQMLTPVERLIALHARDGGVVEELASFYCPLCGIRPIVFTGNREWNNGFPVVECLCLPPFSPKAEYAYTYIWSFPMLQNADAWGLFVEWKSSLPTDDDEEDL